MPVRLLEPFLSELKVVRREPLNGLQGARLAVDAPHWLRRLLKRAPPLEPEALLEATGGLPATLVAAVEKELKAARYDTASHGHTHALHTHPHTRTSIHMRPCMAPRDLHKDAITMHDWARAAWGMRRLTNRRGSRWRGGHMVPARSTLVRAAPCV